VAPELSGPGFFSHEMTLVPLSRTLYVCASGKPRFFFPKTAGGEGRAVGGRPGALKQKQLVRTCTQSHALAPTLAAVQTPPTDNACRKASISTGIIPLAVNLRLFGGILPFNPFIAILLRSAGNDPLPLSPILPVDRAKRRNGDPPRLAWLVLVSSRRVLDLVALCQRHGCGSRDWAASNVPGGGIIYGGQIVKGAAHLLREDRQGTPVAGCLRKSFSRPGEFSVVTGAR